MNIQAPMSDKNDGKPKVLRVDELETIRKELEEEKGKANDYLTRLKYLQADFENYKKRVKKEIAEHIQYGNMQLINALLPILDELEKAIEAGQQSTKKTLQEGVEMTYNKLCKTLQATGLSVIESVEKPFDPNKHEAVDRVQMKGNDGMVVEEIQRGYMLRDVVLRPSLVKVAVDTYKEVKKDE